MSIVVGTPVPITDPPWGTVLDDALLVHKAGAETITGQKTLTSPLLLPNGTAALPGLAFASDPDTGIRAEPLDPNTIWFAAGGVSVAAINQLGFYLPAGVFRPLPAGSAAAPVYSFASDPDTGIFGYGGNTLVLATGAASALYVDASQNITLYAQLYAALGTSTFPGYSFAGDGNTGMYSPGADQIAFATGGVQRMSLAANGDGAFTGADWIFANSGQVAFYPTYINMNGADTYLRWGQAGGTSYYTLASQVSGDTSYRFTQRVDGSQFWGPGNAASDTTLARLSAGVLGIGGQAIVTTSDSRLSNRLPVFDITAYGAVAGSAADQKAAIDAAIAAVPAAGGIVYTPPGNFTTSGGHTTAGKKIQFLGAGPGVSTWTLKGTSNVDMLLIDALWCVVSDMGFDGNYPSNLTAGNCIKVTNARFEAHNLWIANARGNGLWIVGTSGQPAHAALLESIEVYSCQGNGIVVDSYAYDTKGTNIWIGLSLLVGLLINSTEQQWTNLHSWGNTTDGVKITAGDNCKFISAYLETNGGHGISINNARGTIVEGGHLWKNTGHGAYCFNAARSGFSGCRVTDNSWGVFSQDGIRGDGTSTDCRVIGCDFGVETVGAHQAYAVHTISSCDRWIVLGNKAKVADHGTGSTLLVGTNNIVLLNDDGTSPPGKFVDADIAAGAGIAASKISGTAMTLSSTDTVTGAKTFTTNPVTITDVNLVLSTGTGTQIGTGTTQKLAFYGSTPIAKASPGGTFANLLTALGNLGLIVAPTAAIAPGDMANTTADFVLRGGGGGVPAWGTIFNASIAATAAITNTKLDTQLAWGKLNYAEVTANQTGISTITDLTGLSVAVTVGTSRRIKITAHGLVNRTVADGTTRGYIREGSTQLGLWVAELPQNTFDILCEGCCILTPSSGSHTYKLSLERTTGTGTVGLTASSVGFQAFILVEDIGPA